jgi:hypothetical protein
MSEMGQKASRVHGHVWGTLAQYAGRPDPHHVIKWAFGGLGSRIYAMADRTTLHNDDRMMSVFSRHCC